MFLSMEHISEHLFGAGGISGMTISTSLIVNHMGAEYPADG